MYTPTKTAINVQVPVPIKTYTKVELFYRSYLPIEFDIDGETVEQYDCESRCHFLKTDDISVAWLQCRNNIKIDGVPYELQNFAIHYNQQFDPRDEI